MGGDVITWPNEVLQAFHLADPYRNITDVHHQVPPRVVKHRGKLFVIVDNERFHISSNEVDDFGYKNMIIEHIDGSEIEKFADKGHYW